LRGLRIASYALFFCASVALTLFAIHSGLDAAGIDPLPTRLEIGQSYDTRIESLSRLPAASRAYHVAYLGDSMVIDYPEEKQLPSVLQEEIRRNPRRHRPVRVYNFGQVGTGIFDYYLLADQLVRARPDLIIVPFNLANTSPAWRAAFSRPELAGWIAGDRLVEALALPLSWAGLTADRLLFNHALVRVGLLDLWTSLSGEQTRLDQARLAMERRIASPTPGRQTPEETMRSARDNQIRRIRNVPRSKRYSAAGMRHLMGPALDGLQPDHPTLAVLGATVRRFREAEIDVLVYVNPINREHVEELGILDPERLDLTLRSIEGVVDEGGGRFLDLHGILPDRMFRDHTGHFKYEAPLDGTRALAARLAPVVIEIARTDSRRQRARPD
jgi:hypothetical protein